MDRPKIILRPIYHKGKDVVLIKFDRNSEIQARCKEIGATFTITHKGWWVPKKAKTINELFDEFKDIAFIDYEAFRSKILPNKGIETPNHSSHNKHNWNEIQREAIEAFIEKLVTRRYSKSTRNVYLNYFQQFLQHYRDIDPGQIEEKQIRDFVFEKIVQGNLSLSTQNQIVNAIKFYYEHVLGLEKKKYWIERPIKEKRLPRVLSEQDIVRLISSTRNIKHQCIVAMLYSTGLRRGELVRLRVQDIDVERRQVRVNASKGKKDRVTILSDHMITAIQQYLNVHKPKYWFIEGAGRTQYSDNSVGKVIRTLGKRANLEGVTPHVLRHSFATHLMDHGTDVRIIQSLLGHASLETTQIYTHVSNKNLAGIMNPLDKIIDSMSLNTGFIGDAPAKK